MQVIYAYLKWVGDDVLNGTSKAGTGIIKLKFLKRAACPVEGGGIYIAKCKSCHAVKGEGKLNIDVTGYTYPPLWGEHSYYDGAGLYRISSFAGFVKTIMPFGIDYHNPQLIDGEAWDVGAFVNNQFRPHKDQMQDWKNFAQKPIDFPYGPYVDSFSEQQHKFGPFGTIKIDSALSFP